MGSPVALVCQNSTCLCDEISGMCLGGCDADQRIISGRGRRLSVTSFLRLVTSRCSADPVHEIWIKYLHCRSSDDLRLCCVSLQVAVLSELKALSMDPTWVVAFRGELFY